MLASGPYMGPKHKRSSSRFCLKLLDLLGCLLRTAPFEALRRLRLRGQTLEVHNDHGRGNTFLARLCEPLDATGVNREDAVKRLIGEIDSLFPSLLINHARCPAQMAVIASVECSAGERTHNIVDDHLDARSAHAWLHRLRQ